MRIFERFAHWFVLDFLSPFIMNRVIKYQKNDDGTFSSASWIGRKILRFGARDGQWIQIDSNRFKFFDE